MIDMPIGIPQPSTQWGGFDPLTQQAPTRTLASNVEEAGFYYVDENGGGSDSLVYGTPDSPRLTFPPSADGVGNGIPAGSVITLLGDRAWDTSQLQFWAEGTAESPVFVRGDGTLPLPAYKREIKVKGSYIIFENLDLSLNVNEQGIKIAIATHDGSQPHHVVVRNCAGIGPYAVMNNDPTNAGSTLGANGSLGLRIHDIVFYNNNLRGFGDWIYGIENDFHTFNAGSYVDRVWFLYNTVKNSGGDSVQVGTASIANENRATHLYIGGNDFSEDGENNVDIKNCSDVIVSGNILHDIDPNITSDNGVVVIIHDAPNNVWVINNKIKDGGNGVRITSGTNIRVFGNAISGMRRKDGELINTTTGYGQGYGIGIWTAQNVIIANNTLDDNVRHYSVVATSANGIKLHNNIFLNRLELEEWDIYTTTAAHRDINSVNNNVFYGTHPVHIRWDIEVTDLNQHAEFSDCFNTDPLLTMTEGSTKYMISSDASPCFDAGLDITFIQAEFTAAFGTILEGDVFGYQRVQGAAIDIGANERGPLLIPKSPDKASNLQIDVVTETLSWDLNSVNETSIEIFKNGLQLGAALSPGVTSIFIAGISSTADTYEIQTTNAQGSQLSSAIVSDVISISTVTAPTINTIDITAKNYDLIRVGRKSGAINATSYTGNAYGIKNTKSVMEDTSVEVSNGYSYVLGNLSNAVIGTLTMTGGKTFNIHLIDNNYSGVSTTSKFVINNSVINLANTGEFQQHIITITSNTDIDYTYQPTSTQTKSAIGISAIVDVTV